MKKILLIGANGFLGKEILSLFAHEPRINNNYAIFASDIERSQIPKKIPFNYIDITNPDISMQKILEVTPDYVILTAAMTNVDQCEVDKELATKINTEGPKNIIKACEELDSKLIFLSTDFVFDGMKKTGLYSEEDIPNPLSHYGKTKYKAELAIMNSDLEYIICRTAVLYGWNPQKLNFITWILKKLEQNQSIKIVTNQINSPTLVNNLAEIILELIQKDTNGIYHTAGDSALNRYEMAIKCAEVFDMDKSLISSIENLEQTAIRPKNAGLDISKLKSLIGSDLSVYNLEDGLKYMRDNRPEISNL